MKPLGLVAVFLALVAAGFLARPSTTVAFDCPDPAALAWPQNLQAAIPTAKAAAYGDQGRVVWLARGLHGQSGPVNQAKGQCGTEVVRKSVYVQVHPIGMRCAACDLHAFLVHFRGGAWKIWTAF